MQRISRLFVWMICFFSVAAYAANTPDIYTEDKLGIIVTMDKPQFIIKLKSNPTTGYSWFLREYDDRFLEPIKQHFVAPKKDLVGAPGFEMWTFKVKPNAFHVPQQTVIRFVYSRPWEGLEQEKAKQVVFRVSTHH